MSITRNISGVIFRALFLAGALMSCFALTVNAQTTGTRDTLILGSFNEQGYNALLNGSIVVRLPDIDWRQFYSTGPEYFLDQLKKDALHFHAYGDNNGSWEALFSGGDVLFHNYQESKTETIPVHYANDRLPGQTIMFSDAHCAYYGLIRAVSFKTDNKENTPSCVYSINDEEMLFEVFINYNGKVLKGCGSFESADKNKDK